MARLKEGTFLLRSTILQVFFFFLKQPTNLSESFRYFIFYFFRTWVGTLGISQVSSFKFDVDLLTGEESLFFLMGDEKK